MRPVRSNKRRVPQVLRRTGTQLDNLALVPASQLASLDEWQRRARSLPSGTTLLALPKNHPQLQAIGQCIARTQQQLGKRSLIATLHPSS